MPLDDFGNWRTLTATINEIKTPNQLLKTLLFGREQTLHTEDVEWALLTGPRKIAPFIKKNGEALMVEKIGEGITSVKTPHIRIKMPFTAADLIYRRRAGFGFFPSESEVRRAVRQAVARDLEQLEFYIVNSEEYLCAQALTGTINYSVLDEDNFTVTYPKPAGHTVDLGATKYWNNGTAIDLNSDLYTVKKLMSDEHDLTPTDAICSNSAAQAIIALKDQEKALLDNRRVSFGNMDFTQQFAETGAIFLGELGGIRFWAYPRTVDVNGVSTALIRDKYVEFVSATAMAQNIMYYGAIPDLQAWNSGQWVGRRFSKRWEEQDPSRSLVLASSRPLPVMRRPGSVVSMRVVS